MDDKIKNNKEIDFPFSYTFISDEMAKCFTIGDILDKLYYLIEQKMITRDDLLLVSIPGNSPIIIGDILMPKVIVDKQHKSPIGRLLISNSEN